MMQIFSVFLVAGLITVCVYGFLRGMMQLDKDHGMDFTQGVLCVLVMGSTAAAGVWQMTTAEETAAGRFIWLLVHIYFVSCSLTDGMTCQVYDLFQYLGILSASWLLLRGEASVVAGVSILLFAALQYLIFRKFYGEADAMAFFVAALAEAVLGYDLQMYLLHMIIAYLLLSLTQALQENIGGGGKLRKPVAFLPYITVSFWMILIFGERIQTYIK